MSDAAPGIGKWSPRLRAATVTARFGGTARIASPTLLFGLRMWGAVSLALYVAFWLELDNPFWAGVSAAIVCQPQLGASLRKGWFRMVGTMVGAVLSVVLIACFPQDRILLLGGWAAWGAACAFAATVLRNFASYGAALAGITSAIIMADLLGAVGGVDANAAFLIAVTRATETCLGVVSAGVVLAATDLGGAPRRLAAQFADLSAAITAGVTATLSTMGCVSADTQSVRREFIRSVVALDPVIDQTVGESPQLRYYSPVLQNAVDGLFSALAGWRAIASTHALSAGETRREALTILEALPLELRSASQPNAAAHWIHDPVALYCSCELTVRQLLALPAETPSLRLLADKGAQTFAGIAHALNGLALLVADPAPQIPRRRIKQLRVPDWLPALVGAARAFITIGTVALLWIVTGWPDGGTAVTFTTIVTLVLVPRAEHAYNAAIGFTAGAFLDVVVAAIVAFAVLPALDIERFAGFSLVLAVCIVPIGVFLAQAKRPRQVGMFTAMTLLFIPILRPGNPMTYDPATFYNTGLVIVCGAGFGALSYRLLPPLSPEYRTRRLLLLALRDLRHLAMGREQRDWEGLAYGRLSAMPAEATPLQRAQLLVALSAGCEIIQLRKIARPLALSPDLDSALAALAEGRSAKAIARLSSLDAGLAAIAPGEPPKQVVLRGRSSVLALSQTLVEHAAYFDTQASA